MLSFAGEAVLRVFTPFETHSCTCLCKPAFDLSQFYAQLLCKHFRNSYKKFHQTTLSQV